MLSANRAMADFLRIDTQMGLTFAGIALKTEDPAKRKRTTRVARNAYDTVVRLKGSVKLRASDADSLHRSLQRLMSELERLGETF